MAAAPAPIGLRGLPDHVEAVTLDTFHWLRTDLDQALLAVGIAVALYALFWGLRWGAVRLLGEGYPITSWRGFARRIIRRTRSLFIAALAAWLVSNSIDAPGPLTRAIGFVFTVAFAIQGALWLREIILALVERRAGETEDHEALKDAMNIITVLVNVVVWVLAVILVLDNLGVNVTALVAGLGVGGIAIGLAAQGIFSDLFAALSILFDRPFRVGDTIRFGDITGSVEAIGLKTTRIRATTGEQVIVSNTKLLDLQIRNLRRIEARTTVMTFHLSLASPTAALQQVPAMVATVLKPLPHVSFRRAHVTAVTATAIDVETEFTVADAALITLLDTKQMVLLGVLDGFAALGLKLADANGKIA
ncbi:MAG: mechanosensitive ion channel protein MscS [Alphaproteobacteria bacterium PA4]|nr:MAG: mechanosensitive ion channel protein MscS [Alphaproteobacteria bacterium PA4]